MDKLTLHAKIEFGLAALLLLGSCDGLPHRFTNADYDRLQYTYDLADAARANSANALSLCSDLDSRVSDIETRLNM